jgi:NADH:ubiquinone reductase (H+-translocating)
MSRQPTPLTDIVVLGAGYAGLLATMRLARKLRGRPVRITLVNASDTFIERLRLHQFASGQLVPARSIPRTLRGTDVRFIQARVMRLTPEERTVIVREGGQERALAYDVLVYALGSDIERQGVPGVAEHAYTLTPRGERSAETLRTVLPALDAAGARVVVCGGGPTGIETAAEFATAYPRLRVKLVTEGAFAAQFGPAVARRMRRIVEREGVAITDHTTVAEVRVDGVVTSDGAIIPAEMVLWAGGFAVSPLAREAGLEVNVRGQIVVDTALRSRSHPSIYAIGDAMEPAERPGVPVRMSAVVAAISGAAGADSLSATLLGRRLRPFSFAYLGQGIALGRGNAIGFNNYPEDVPIPPYLTGWLGYQVREVFVRYLAVASRFERRRLGSFFWLGKGRYAAQQRRAAAVRPARDGARPVRAA